MNLKYILFLLFFLFRFNSGYTQGWISLKTPLSNILGQSILKVENNEIEINPASNIPKDIRIDERASSSFIKDLGEELKREIEVLINSSGFNVTEVKILNLKIRRINNSDIFKFDACNCFVVEGMCADRYELVVKKNKLESKNNSYSALVELLESENQKSHLINVVTNIDSLQEKENIIYNMKINSPDVYFKFRMIRYVNQNLNSKFNSSYFFNYSKSRRRFKHVKIPNDFNEISSGEETTIIHPGSKNRGEFDRNSYKLVSKKENGKLKLFLYFKENTIKSDWIIQELERDEDEQGLGHWRTDEKFVNNIIAGSLIKSVYVSVNADQVSADKIKVNNCFIDGNNLRLTTFIKYLDGKIENVNEKTNCSDNQEQTDENVKVNEDINN